MSNLLKRLIGNERPETPKWAKDAINMVRTKRLTTLNLSSPREKPLIVIPPQVFELTFIHTLHLGGNQLTSVPDNIIRLTNLRKLDLRVNKLTKLPNNIGRLTHLQILDLSSNSLTKLPESIRGLINLETLDIRNNELAYIPDGIEHLTLLQMLNLHNNRLKTIPHTIGKLTSLQTLDLSNNELTNIPETVGQLADLQKLSMQNNNLTVIPHTVGKLTNLQTLDLSHNQLTNFPETVGQLAVLQNLNFHSNHLTAVPQTIAQLTNLQTLDLSDNELITVPESIGQVASLQKLELYSNRLKTIPQTVSQLTNLRLLNLSNNQLTAIPEAIGQLNNLHVLYLEKNYLTYVPPWLVELPKLTSLYLSDNPIKTPPPEVLGIKTSIVSQKLPSIELNEMPLDFEHDIDWFASVGFYSRQTDIKALQSYFRQSIEVGEESLYEAKLLIVGEPGAGKTSLTRKLINPNAPMPRSDESTEGIDVHTWTFLIANIDNDDSQTSSATDFRVNIWDFGGQEIYHSTHQFFLTRRSLYIVVADAREQKTDFFHWLDLIEHLSDSSPVFIFNNAFQNRHWAINEQQLRAHFPETFQEPFAFNLADDETKLAHLRQIIQEQITQLPHVGDVLPRTWVNVRRALETYTYPTANLNEFLKLCKENGFTRTADALQLSGYLHDLGVILHFQDDPLLKRTIIINPEWGTDAVYRVLDSDVVKANQGYFTRNELHDIWDEYQYVYLRDELLALMMKFQLCYAIPNQDDQYIAPQLLSEQPPEYELTAMAKENAKNNLYLRYKYEAFMPKGLLTRFIVSMHPHIATNDNHQLVWRTGVILDKDGAQAEVVEFYHRREIRIQVTGKNMRDLLTIISYQLDELHRPFHRLKFDKLIPCNCATCRNAEEPYFYRMDVLKTRLEHGKAVIECDVPPFETVQIRPLLDDLGAAVQLATLSTLLRTLNRDFNDDEFRTLCLEMSVNYDNLPGEGLEGKQRELLLMLERNGRLPELINLLRQKRPNFNW